MKIDTSTFKIPEIYNSDIFLELLKNEPIEDIEEMFVKTAAQFKRDLKEWFPEKPKTGSFKAYFKTLEPKKPDPSYLTDKDVETWSHEDFELIKSLSMAGLKYKKMMSPRVKERYDEYVRIST